MEQDQIIHRYYDSIAAIYDADRFGNSYGRYIHKQEQDFLSNVLSNKHSQTLDLGCGTGRFLEYAGNGIDISEEMLNVAKSKYPGKSLQQADAANTPFSDNTFEQALCMHVFMHLSKEKAQDVINEAYRILKTGGRFVFDFPSAKRRRSLQKKTHQWHGANEYSISDIRNITDAQWRLVTYTGVLFLPVHRIPKKIRPYIIRFDSWLCRSFLKEFSSYLIVMLEKK